MVGRLDRRPAGERGAEALETVLPAAEAPAGEVAHQLLQAARGLEARVRVGGRVDDDAAAGERLDLEPHTPQQLAVLVDRVELGGSEIERQRQQQALGGRAVAGELPHHVLVEHALVRRMLVHDRDAVAGLKEDVGVENLK